MWPEFLLLCCRPRKTVFKRKRAVSGPSALLGPEMIKFTPNFCYCAVYQEKAVFKRKRPFLHLPFGARKDKIRLEFLLLCCIPCECQQRSLREASGRGLRGPLKRTIWRMVRLGARFGVPHSKGDLTGYSPAACRAYRAAHSCLWDWELCRPPEGFRLQSCLACRLRRVRPARRPRAHSV